MSGLLVAADDRTGALETAGACADAGMVATVVPADPAAVPTTGRACTVVDLASRHLDPAAAATAAHTLEAVQPAGSAAAHKIDSTLRGNWAPELVARHRAGGRPVLVVPAFPAAGRTCVHGVVLVDGRPVGDGPADARRPVTSSRPADHLRAAGADEVVMLDADRLDGWSPGGGCGFAVCDAATGTDLARIADWWGRHRRVLVAGPAAVIGVVAQQLAGTTGRARPASSPAPGHPALVVCGSLHPVARAQVAELVAAGAVAVRAGTAGAHAVDRAQTALRAGRDVVVLAAAPRRVPVTAGAAAATAERLAGIARALLAAAPVRTLVIVGGDTAAAVLGTGPVTVGGTLAPGVPWFHLGRGDGPLVLTKPGGFGHPGLLVDVLHRRAENGADADRT